MDANISGSGTSKSALIIGASRGLGLGLAQEFTSRGWQVTATVRQPITTGMLRNFTKLPDFAMLDINRPKSVAAFLTTIEGKVFDVVFINAGIMGAGAKTAEAATPEEISHLFMTNASSPLSLAVQILRNVRPGEGVLAFMTSVLGSVTRGSGTYAPLYSASKAALNQLTRSFVAGLETEITVLSIHPGWVKTDMGGAGADIDVATSVRGIVNLLETKSGSHKHEFLDYQGKTIPW